MSCSREFINHPTIGPIQGSRRCANVNQFLGVQYATLKDRFAQGELLEQYQSAPVGPLDAAKLGYGSYFPRMILKVLTRHGIADVVVD